MRSSRCLRTTLLVAFLCSWNSLACSAQGLAPPLPAFSPVTSTFCEYRAGHFHAGLDFSTGGKTGVPVLAVGPGSLFRVRVSGTGYGKAVYVRLDNGMTAVYGHLDRFSDKINSYVLFRQLRSLEYEQDILLGAEEVRVKTGEVLGYSGDTGASSGPHLHFELRRGETALNPLGRGYALGDAVRPTFRYARLIPLGAESEIDGENAPCVIHLRDPGRRGAYMGTKAPDVTGPFMVSAVVFDKTENADNMLAVYETRLFVDDSLVFERRFDEVEEPRTHEVELAYDQDQARMGQRYSLNMCRFEGSQLRSLGRLKPGAGIVNPDALGLEGTHTLRIEASDVAGNTSTATVKFVCVRRPSVQPMSIWKSGDSLSVETQIEDQSSAVESVWLEYSLGSLSEEFSRVRMEKAGGSFRTGEVGGWSSRAVSNSGTSKNSRSRYYVRIALPDQMRDLDERGVVGIFRAEAVGRDGAASAWHTIAMTGGEIAPEVFVELTVRRRADFAELTAKVTPWYLRPRIGIAARDTIWLKVREEERGRYRAVLRFTHALAGGGSALCVLDGATPGQVVASEPLNLYLVKRGSEGSVEGRDGGMVFSYTPETFYRDTYVSIERRAPEPGGAGEALPSGLSFASDVFSVEPPDVVFDKHGTVVIRCANDVSPQDKVGVYRRQPGLGWQYVGALPDSLEKTVSARVRTFCDFALIKDVEPPTISRLRPRTGRIVSNRQPRIRATVRDVGSGVEWKDMTVTVDGAKALCVWEPRYSRLSFVHTGNLRPGKHHVTFEVRDRAGNLSVAETSFTVSR